jgi:HTH-type transcriptional regulator / antitoxin HipB
MSDSSVKVPLGNSSSNPNSLVPNYESAVAIRSSVDLGVLVRKQRKRLALKQLDIAGLGNTGNRFIVELESGKPTLQLQKVLDVLELLGLELIVRPKTARKLS